jgi:branched-chain amino acid aminotransferase
MDYQSYKQILNGSLVSASDMLVPANDIGFLRGFGVFDYLITYDGHPFHLDFHIQRLFRSAAIINLSLNSISADQIAGWVLEGLKANNDGADKSIRIVATGGRLNAAMQPSNEKPLVMAMFAPRPHYAEEVYKNGTRAISANYLRPYPEAKTLNYLDGVIRINDPRNNKPSEIIYYNSEQVFEGTTTNVFAVVKNSLITPKSNILKGITRKVILENLSKTVPVQEKDFTIDDLRAADEIFITNSSKEIWPITTLDDKKVGSGSVGPLTKELGTAYKKYVGEWLKQQPLNS